MTSPNPPARAQNKPSITSPVYQKNDINSAKTLPHPAAGSISAVFFRMQLILYKKELEMMWRNP
jgi:hypothetical protein